MRQFFCSILIVLLCSGCGGSSVNPKPGAASAASGPVSKERKVVGPEKLEAWKAQWKQQKSWKQMETFFDLHGASAKPVEIVYGKGKFQEKWSGVEVELNYDTEDFESIVGQRDDMTDHEGTLYLNADMTEMVRFDLNDQIYGEDSSPIKVRLLRQQ
jgi:hypothetical protein